jgi:hypothetical protein
MARLAGAGSGPIDEVAKASRGNRIIRTPAEEKLERIVATASVGAGTTSASEGRTVHAGRKGPERDRETRFSGWKEIAF